jgi:hypothetical protein
MTEKAVASEELVELRHVMLLSKQKKKFNKWKKKKKMEEVHLYVIQIFMFSQSEIVEYKSILGNFFLTQLLSTNIVKVT